MYLEFVSQLSDKELLFLLENALRIKLGYFVDINIINIHIYMGDIYDIFVIKTNMGDILINDFLIFIIDNDNVSVDLSMYLKDYLAWRFNSLYKEFVGNLEFSNENLVEGYLKLRK